MTRRSGGALLITLLLAAGCSDSKQPTGKGRSARGEAGGPGDAGAPAAPAEQVIAVAIAAAERPGAPAMERDVAIPVEEAVSRVPNVARVRSVSGARRVDLHISMASGTDPTAAMGAIQAAVTGARLPAGVAPPEVRLRPARRVWLSAASEALSLDAMGSVRDRIAESLARASGVRSVTSCGAGDPVMRVVVDAGRLSELGVDPAALRAELGRAAAGVGSIEDLSGAVLSTAAGGATIAVRDVAAVERGARSPRCTALAGGKSALSIEVGMDGASDALDKEIDAIAASLPPDVRLTRLSGAVLELHVHPPSGLDGDGLRALGASLAAKIESASGVSGVIVESGELTATPDSLAPPMRVLVAGTAAPDHILAAAHSPDHTVRIAAGPWAAAPILIQGDELEPLHRAAETVAAAVAGTAGIAAAAVAGAALSPRIRVELDAAAIAAKGVQRPDVSAAIALVVDGAQVGDLIEAGRRIPIRLEIAGARPDSVDPAALAGVLPSLQVRAGKDRAPLSSLVRVTVAAEPLTILRHGRRRAVEIWLQPKPGTAGELASAAAASRRAAEAALPAGIAISAP